MKAVITTIAHYLPQRVVNNTEISNRYPKVGTPADIFQKTGIMERRYSNDLTTGEMAAESVKNLLSKAGVKPSEIDLVLVGTLSPDHFYPSTAVTVIHKVEAVNAWGYDVVAACPSFLFAIPQAVTMIEIGRAKKVVVCGADRMSKTINAFDYKTGVLFGDAAASVLIEAKSDEELGINNCFSKVVADDLEDVYFRTPFNCENWSDEKFELDGKKVYRHGVDLTSDFIGEYLKKYSLTLEDFKFIVPHQANIRMLKEIAVRLNVSFDKFLTNIHNVGNTAGASVPLCLSQKVDEGIVKKGDRLLLVSFGAGYTLSITDLFF